jgi:cell division septum initiation protein DivIVA
MTDKEFKRLSRSQLIDIIYQLQLKQKELEEENRKLKAEVGDKRIRLREAGNIAEAALAMHNVMQSAQDAADQYLEEIRAMKQETAEACNRILEKAKQEAAAIVARANQKHTVYDSAVDAILKEYQQEK